MFKKLLNLMFKKDSKHQAIEVEEDDEEMTPWKVGSVTDPDARIVRVVHISDTHGDHSEIKIPLGDVLVHSGDFFNHRDTTNFNKQTESLDEFFKNQPQRHKIFVAGNHEVRFLDKSSEDIQARLPHVTYLQDTSVVIEGLKFYGSPWNTQRRSAAYAYELPDDELRERWSKIPDDIDVLVTHSPPARILDGGGMGCRELRNEIFRRIRPLVHLFGHKHLNDVILKDGILFANGAQEGFHRPHVIDIYVNRLL